MFHFLRRRFAAKLAFLIALTFLIPVATSIITILATSNASIEWFHQKSKETSPFDPHLALNLELLKEYEKGRTTTLVTTFVVVSFVLAGIVILLSLFLLRQGMMSLAELRSAADLVRQRQFHFQLHTHSHDEFGNLIRAFQNMADHLNATTVAKELAEESSRLRSEFLANMSHEIRTPLNGILGLAQVLMAEETDLEKKNHLETIHRCGHNLLHMINEILELSKLEAGKMEVFLEPVDLHSLLRETVDTVKPLLRKKKLSLSMHIDPQCPTSISADRHKLSRVLLNLLGNASKFTEHGGITLTVKPFEKQPQYLLFIIEDTGLGIAAERLPFIFESFVQAEDYLSRPSEGTGLGLAITKKLVELMGGVIWVESVKAQGTQFFFTVHT